MKIILSKIKQKQKSYILKTICLMTPTHKKVSNGVIKEINFGDNIEIPSDDEVAIGGPKKMKIIPNPNIVHLVSNRIIKNVKSEYKKEV